MESRENPDYVVRRRAIFRITYLAHFDLKQPKIIKKRGEGYADMCTLLMYALHRFIYRNTLKQTL